MSQKWSCGFCANTVESVEYPFGRCDCCGGDCWERVEEMRDEELRELVEKWRKQADAYVGIYERHDINILGEASILRMKADELERVLDK